jgi:hypothetical protein
MEKRKAMFLAPLAIAAAALPAIWMGPASATTTSSGGVVHLYQVDTALNGQPGRARQTDSVTLTGALADYGVDYEAAGGGNINVFDLQKGAIAVDLSKWGRGSQPSPIENPSNCSFSNVVVGPVRIVQNELATSAHPFPPGAYRNLHGTFYVKAVFAGVVSGTPYNCNFSQTGNTPTGLDFVEATGIVSFSG